MKKKSLTKRLIINKETLLQLAVAAGGPDSVYVACRTNTCADCFSTSCNVMCRTH